MLHLHSLTPARRVTEPGTIAPVFRTRTRSGLQIRDTAELNSALRPSERAAQPSPYPLIRASLNRGFTLLELLTVIAIIGILAAITIPNLSSFKPNVMAAGTSQLLSDVGRARQLAISRRTDVYMVFVPPGFWNNVQPIPQAFETLYDKQYVGYTFVALRRLGDQPGAGVPQYLSEWRTLPSGVFIAQSKFFSPTVPIAQRPFVITDNNETVPFNSFVWTNNIPFPTERDNLGIPLPYIAFNYLGGLKPRPGLDVAQDEFIPLALGSAGVSRDAASRKARDQVAIPQENPPGNSTNAFNIIRIDGLTGRARVERREIQ